MLPNPLPVVFVKRYGECNNALVKTRTWNGMFLRMIFAAAVLGSGPPLAAAEKLAVLELSTDGEVQIAPDGHVSDCHLSGKLTPAVADIVDRHVRGWRFEPILVDGHAVEAKTALHLDLQAEPIAGKDDYLLRITNVRFGEPRRNAQMKPPRYPLEAVHVGLGAKVLLYVHLDEAGKVIDVDAYQTNLNAKPSSEFEARRWREVFEKSSIAAVKNWRFDISETVNGKPIGTTAIVPFVYSVVGGPIRKAAPGEWQPYLPGPVHPAPWLKPEQVAASRDVFGLKEGQALSLDSRFRLKDNVIGSTL